MLIKKDTYGVICDLLASGTYSGDRGITRRQSYRPPPIYSCRSTNKYVAHVEQQQKNFKTTHPLTIFFINVNCALAELFTNIPTIYNYQFKLKSTVKKNQLIILNIN